MICTLRKVGAALGAVLHAVAGGGRWVIVVLVAVGAYFVFFRPAERVGPEPQAGGAAAGPVAPARTVTAERGEVALYEEAVGTVRSRMRVAVAAQVTARVLSVAAQAGATVRAGDPLVVLDGRELAARFAQAKEGLAAADAARGRAQQAKVQGEARLTQARARHERVKGFVEKGAATTEQMEAAEADFLSAQAAVADAVAAIAAAEARHQEAREAVTEAEVGVGHATIGAPIDGVVAERSVEPGDLAWPGRTLLVVLDPHALRLEAQVREGLIARVAKGVQFPVELPGAGRTVTGTVAEILPSADPQSRTFEVRVDFDPGAGVYPGMFGRLRFPTGKREVVRLAAAAVVRVGQLETVLVRDGARWSRRLITTGAAFEGGQVEVLSGLAGGETVGLPEERR